ncbi:four helix bundle protein, partial [Thalassobellus citreus]|uniref:four helix bundle protein n=1 Tax=Thalassobellus citreus TaxID=3367752 RepID=UPI0037ABB42F
VFVSTKTFPKEYKYSLGRDMERDVLVLMRCIYRANRSQEKTVFLNDFLDNFEILKLEIRVCVDLKLVSIKRQSVLASLMNSIGKQVVGWKKSTITNARIV